MTVSTAFRSGLVESTVLGPACRSRSAAAAAPDEDSDHAEGIQRRIDVGLRMPDEGDPRHADQHK
jgi:hypothetical protein